VTASCRAFVTNSVTNNYPFALAGGSDRHLGVSGAPPSRGRPQGLTGNARSVECIARHFNDEVDDFLETSIADF
jgi:hypothetical protein